MPDVAVRPKIYTIHHSFLMATDHWGRRSWKAFISRNSRIYFQRGKINISSPIKNTYLDGRKKKRDGKSPTQKNNGWDYRSQDKINRSHLWLAAKFSNCWKINNAYGFQVRIHAKNGLNWRKNWGKKAFVLSFRKAWSPCFWPKMVVITICVTNMEVKTCS